MLDIVSQFPRINSCLNEIKSFGFVLNCSLTCRMDSYFIVVFFQYDSILYDDLSKIYDLIVGLGFESDFSDVSYFDNHLVLSVGLS